MVAGIIIADAHVTNDNPAWSTVRPFASMMDLYWCTVSSYWKEKSNEQPGIH